MTKRTQVFFLVMMLLIIPIILTSSTEGSRSSGWDNTVIIQNDLPWTGMIPSISMDHQGNAIAVWQQHDGTRFNIWANRYLNGIGWEIPVLIEIDNSGSAEGPKVSSDPNGNAIAVWEQDDGARKNIWANRYTVGKGWGVAQLIETDDSGNSVFPNIAIAPSGNAVAVWQQNDGTRFNIWANHYIIGVGWGMAQLIESDSGSAWHPEVAVDPSGNAIAVWYQYDGTRYNIWSNRYTAGVGWGTAQLIEDESSGSAERPSLVMDTAGNAIVVWLQYVGVYKSIWANRYNAGVGWGTAQRIQTEGSGSSYNPHISIDASGNAMAVWPQYTGTRVSIHANRFAVDTGWGTEENIGIDIAGESQTPKVSSDPSGNAIAVWEQHVDGNYHIGVNVYTVDSGWGTAHLLEMDYYAMARSARLAHDPFGNAIAVWHQSNEEYYQIRARRYVMPDTTPPILTLTSPEDGMGSDFSTVTVSGITEPGTVLDINGVRATVRGDGSFSIDISLFPGSNTIVVTSTDASGNSAIETRIVTYTDPLVDRLSSILENLTSIEEELGSMRDLIGSMDPSDNTTSMIDTLEKLESEIDMAKENLTLLKERLSAIEGEGNETVDLSGILDLIDALEYDIDRNDAEISTLKNDVSSQAADIDSLKGFDPEDNEDLKDDVASLKAIVAILGATLFVAIMMGILLFIIMLIMIVRRKGHRIEE